MPIPKNKHEHEHFSKKTLEKQQLKDWHQKLSALVGSYLVLIEEGKAAQAESARDQSKSAFHKFGPEMKKSAFALGEKFPELVGQYLESVEAINLSSTSFIDAGKIKDFFEASLRLEKMF
jgi:hypothetical protein